MVSMIWMFLLFAAGNALSEPCLAVGEGAITASVLAASVPELEILDPGFALFRAPELGIRRVISARELNLALRRNAPTAKTVDPLVSVCVVRRSRRITEQEIRDAVVDALTASGTPKTDATPGVTVEVLDFSARDVGEGELRFPPQAPSRTDDPRTPVVWRGWHKSRSGQRLPIWAKVRLSERVTVPFAARDLAVGETIDSGAVVFRESVRFPSPSRSPAAEVIGKVPKRWIHAGETVLSKDLAPAAAVRRGDAVDVQVVGGSGSVFLRLAGRAETSGSAGQRIAVSSAFSKRMFQAVVKEKGHVLVTFDPAPDPAPASASAAVGSGSRIPRRHP